MNDVQWRLTLLICLVMLSADAACSVLATELCAAASLASLRLGVELLFLLRADARLPDGVGTSPAGLRNLSGSCDGARAKSNLPSAPIRYELDPPL